MKLREAIIEFENYTSVTKSNATGDYYKYYLRCLKEGLGDIECQGIDKNLILSYLQGKKEANPKVSNATLNKHVGALKTAVKYATSIEIKFSKFKENKKIIPTVSTDSKDKIFNYLENRLNNRYSYRNYLFLKVLFDTGLRLSEITNLRIDNLNSEDSMIHVKKTKTDVDRYVVLSEQTKTLLLDFINTQNIQNYIFTDFKVDKPLTTSAVECFISRLKKKLKLSENVTPHKWRHTFATKYIRSGGNLETLRLLMGHSNLNTTQKYMHLDKFDILKEYRKVMLNPFVS